MKREVYTAVKELLSNRDIFVATEDDGSEWINIQCVPDLLARKIEECIKVVRDKCSMCGGKGALYSPEICEECEYCGRPIEAIRTLRLI